jgi:hypothetical protein
MAPLWGTRIIGFGLEPSLQYYSPNSDVVAFGRLQVDKFGWGDAPPGRPIKIFVDGTDTGVFGVTEYGGEFHVPFAMPSTPGTYAVRAFFPGFDMGAFEDPSWSPAVVARVGVPTPPTPAPAPSPTPSEFLSKYWWALAIGAGAVGIMVAGVKRK